MTRLLASPWTLAAAIACGVLLWMASGTLLSETAPAAAGGGPASASRAPAAAPERRTAVQVREQAPERIERRLEVSARTAPARRVLLKAETTGRVVAAPAARGARLQAGEPLLRLDRSDREVRLTQAEALVRQRELEYEAQKALDPTGFVTEASVAEALALLEAARAELARARLDLERMVVRAPFDGVLLEREVEVGDYVTPGDPLLTWLDDRTLVVAGDVSEKNIDHLHVGMEAEAVLLDETSRAGRVRYIAPLADASTRTFLVELEIDNAAGTIPLGATARLQLPLDTVWAHPLSPALLALDDSGEVGVKIVDGEDRVRFVPVEVARAGADTVWVTGLPSPARIITVGQGYVSDGQLVETRFESGPDGRAGRPAPADAEAGTGAKTRLAETQAP